MIEPDRPLSLGWPEAYDCEGVRRRIAKMDALWPLKGDRLLDVGCGNGSYTVPMGTSFHAIHGIEIEPVRLADFRTYLEGRGDAEYYNVAEMSSERLEFPDNYFDVVTAIETIEHIVDLDVAVREIFRVLKPEGAFLITAPNRWFPVETHSFKIRGKEYPAKKWPFVPYLKPLHRRISTARNFRPKDLQRLLEPVGFELVGIDYLMPPFERRVKLQALRPITDRLEKTWFKNFGVSVIAAYRKP
jgi:ubiquinone/menaquinone biosynthesis C-methylase UbiE